MINSCIPRAVTEADLPMLLEWRNHPSIRHFMRTQHHISLDEHQNWFVKVSKDINRCLLIIEDKNQPIGYVQFTQVEDGGVADWGFYAKPNGSKGDGYKLCSTALNYGFSTLRLHKVCGQALEGNNASIKLHKRLGFSEEGMLRDQVKLENEKYLGLHYFGLLDYEWESINLLKESIHGKD